MATRGRPTKLTDELREKAEYYAEEGYIENDDAVPSVAGLSVYLNVSKSSLHLWAREDEEFSFTLESLKHRQEKMLMTGGLTNSMNSTIVKLMMANHGYSEKQAIEHSGEMVNHNLNAEVSKQDIDDFLSKL